MSEKFYKPLLGCNLEFPADWVGVIVYMSDTDAGFLSYQHHGNISVAFESYIAHGIKCFMFFSYEELYNAVYGPESENRQLHVMADLISWYCKGPGIGGPLKPQNQIELPF